MNKNALYDDLLKVFINYQHRLDCPMPSATETPASIRLKYLNDPIFHRKVESLASGVMQILEQHLEK